jgi:uncharacterized protein (DUF1330 family)
MSAYVLIEAKVSDPVAYENYNKQAQETVKQYGGRSLARGGRLEVLEGNWAEPERLAIVEFDSLEQARKFYNSPEYVAVRALRRGAADVNMLVVEGLQ